jgi:drug/metabolite transporter (DMT)-like permease
MGSNRILGIVLLVIGAILLFFGYNASQSLGDQLTETVTGKFTDETMWYIIAGAASVVVGAVLTLRK